jgi:hypothetical protein
VDDDTETEIANILNCANGKMPMRYLGFPISDRKLRMEAFGGVVDKMRKRLQPWKGKHLSSGGRLVTPENSITKILLATWFSFIF